MGLNRGLLAKKPVFVAMLFSETCAQGIRVRFSIKNAATYQQKSKNLKIF